MKSVCEKYGALFILDEVMSGMGRMGTTHGWQAYGNVKPDLQAVAKGLGGGYVNIGAVLISPRVAEGIQSLWKHGHTYQVSYMFSIECLRLIRPIQAQPAACAGALAVQDVIKNENLLENINKQGEYLASLLRERLTSSISNAAPFVFDIRGRGGFWALEFDFSSAEGQKLDFGDHKTFAIAAQQKALENGLIIMGLSGGANLEGSKGDHLILAPAYNVTKENIESMVDILVRSVEESLKEAGI